MSGSANNPLFGRPWDERLITSPVQAVTSSPVFHPVFGTDIPVEPGPSNNLLTTADEDFALAGSGVLLLVG